jgi:uncharacterized damage-inducible protein DinB
MTEMERIIDQMQRAFSRDAWCGSSLQEALAGITADCAAARPLKSAHNIWEIVLHVAAWKGAVRQRLAGEPVRVPLEGDWPAVGDVSTEAWDETLAHLERRHEELMKAVGELTDGRLDDMLITEQSRESGGGVSCYVTLHGMAQHDLYHAGQIAILKKSCVK